MGSVRGQYHHYLQSHQTHHSIAIASQVFRKPRMPVSKRSQEDYLANGISALRGEPDNLYIMKLSGVGLPAVLNLSKVGKTSGWPVEMRLEDKSRCVHVQALSRWGATQEEG